MLILLTEVVRKHLGIMTPARTLLSFPGNAIRKHPRTTALLLILLVLTGMPAGIYIYALGQWKSAQDSIKAGRLDEAQKRLEWCLFLWPRSIPVHLAAARAARLRGDLESAEVHLNRCLKLNGGASEAIQLEFLLMRVQGGGVDEVAPDLLTLYVEQNHPESTLILETLSRVYLQDLRYGPAFNSLSLWVKAAPDSAEAVRWHGYLLERLNDYDAAKSDYIRALELDPGLVPVRLRLAEMYLERADPLAALPHLELLRKQCPDRPDVEARLGQCRFLQGEMEDSRRLLESAVARLPNDSAALIYLGKLEMQENRAAKAEVWLRRAWQVEPTDTETEHLLAGCLQAQGRTDEAAALLARREKDKAQWDRVRLLLRQEAEKADLDAAALTDIGVLFLAANERVGRYWLHRALERDRDYQPALKALAEHYESKGDQEKAAVYRRQLKPGQEPSGSRRQAG